jgi:hypothetical protein
MNVIAPRLFDWVAENEKDLVPIGILPEPGPRTDVEAIPAIAMEQEGGPAPGQEELLRVAGVIPAALSPAQPAFSGPSPLALGVLGAAILTGLVAILRRRKRAANST